MKTSVPRVSVLATIPALLLAMSTASISCTSHRVGFDPIEIKPIKVTVDVNVQVQRKLDDFFDFEDELVTTDDAKKDDDAQASNKEGQ